MAEEKKDNNFNEEEIEENEDVENRSNGDSEDSGSKDKSGSDSNGSSKGGKSEKTFTQDQVSRMMTREKNQGRNAAYKELGIDPKDTKVIAQFKAFVESQKTEEQKAAERESADKAKQVENERRVAIAEAKAEAMMMGVKTQYVEDAVTLVLSRFSEDTDVKTLLGELKAKYPAWFGESGDTKDKAGQKGTGSSVKQAEKGDKKGEAEKGLGARLAAQRRSGTKKSSYWGAKK